MEVGVGDKKYDKNDRLDDEKEAACPIGTHPDDMEVGVGYEKDDNNDRLDDEKEAACPDDMRKKWQHPQQELIRMIWVKVLVKQKMTGMREFMM